MVECLMGAIACVTVLQSTMEADVKVSNCLSFAIQINKVVTYIDPNSAASDIN